jgi:antitoxin component YwqK of YwqJK toxin-antitoxin module
MKYAFPLLLIVLIQVSCTGNNAGDSISKPYKFDRDKLDKLVKEKKAIYDIGKRSNGTLMYEKYYLGDSVKYEIGYDLKSNIQSVSKFDEHGQTIWEERYYPNGQRKAHYNMKTAKNGNMIENTHDGYFEQYYENGNVMERGMYKSEQIIWMQKLTKEGLPLDTIFYDYGTNPE